MPKIKKLFTLKRHDAGLGWENTARTMVVLLAFLFPVLIWPWTDDSWETAKVSVLLVLVSLAWISSVIAMFRRHHHDWQWRPVDWFSLAVVAAAGASTLWSLDRRTSLAGIGGSLSETWTVIVILASLAFLVGQLFREPKLQRWVWFSLAAGAAAAVLLQIFQLAGTSLLPTVFSDHPLLNVVSSSPLDIAMIAAILGGGIMIGWRQCKERWQQAAGWAVVIAAMMVMMFFRQPLAWAVFALAMVGVVMQESRQGAKANSRIIGIALGLAVIGLLIQLTDVAKYSKVPAPVNVRLDQASSLAITSATLKHRPLLGSGPSTWFTDFVQSRPTSFNATPVWNTRFMKAQGEWWQLAATTGVLGVLVWAVGLGWIVLRLWQTWQRQPEPFVMLSLMFVTLTMVVGFFTPWSLVWMFALWLIIGLSGTWWAPEKKGTVALTPGWSVAAAIAVMALVVFWIPATKILASQIQVNRAERLVGKVAPLRQVHEKLSSALQLDPSNLAAADLRANAYATAAELAQQAGTTQTVADDIRAGVTVLQKAILQQPKNPLVYEAYNNYLNRLSSYITDAESEAAKNFLALRRLEPASPIHDVGYGQTLMVARQRLLQDATVSPESQQQASALLTKALEAYRLALKKKPDYAQAQFALAQGLEASDDLAAALEQLEAIAPAAQAVSGYWREVAIVQSQLKHAAEAEAAFQQALKLDPTDVLTYLAYGQHAQDVGDTATAKSILNDGLQRVPKDARLQTALDALQ